MPFGLCNAPATFERLMEKVLRKFLTKICLVYLDDVIVFEGITTDPEKIMAVKDWPVSHTKKQLRSFLGFCSYYRKFVKGFSSVAKPLFVLTEDKTRFSWGKEPHKAFNELKHDLEGQLARWLERLQRYDFEIIYRKGLLHGNADGLSRRLCESIGCNYCTKIEKKTAHEPEKIVVRIVIPERSQLEWRKDQREDPDLAIVVSGKEAGSAHHVWIPLQRILLAEFIGYIGMLSALKTGSCGHFGINKTLDKIRKRFFWATCKQDVEEWCRSCMVCTSRKGPLGKGKPPLQIYNVNSPFERVQMDILGPLPYTTSEVMEILGIKKTRTTALHPQSDGQVERQHQTITNFLAKYISSNQKDWDRWIPMFLLAYRTSKHETTGLSPSELCFGRDLKMPLDLFRGSPPNSSTVTSGFSGDYLENLRRKLEEIHMEVRRRVDIGSSHVKVRYDRRVRQLHFKKGQKVWFYNPHRIKGKAPKLQRNWEGPYSIVRKLSDVVFCIQKTPKHRKKIVHADRPSELQDFLEDGPCSTAL
ncbi:PREDICTED: uncharacterized protein LOC105557572 [Vollenhovia emeryi]|uniref:uncharacterized protein LOC105557572 n=1 Tax=Vollenhovia emeryi TaxID=411798 RepID=UPI0005F4AEC2|nr:PREDICTED: uncharacterized protein LOC105557572 [Vollenhovia emeryi]